MPVRLTAGATSVAGDRQPVDLVSLRSVSFGYGRTPVLQDVDYRVGSRDFTGIVGPSGSGKTTLLRLLLGTVAAGHGEVVRASRLAVSYVPQLETVNWNFPVTVGECVLMSRRSGRLSPRATRAERLEVEGVLERTGLERALRDARLGPIGGGTDEIMKEILGRSFGL